MDNLKHSQVQVGAPWPSWHRMSVSLPTYPRPYQLVCARCTVQGGVILVHSRCTFALQNGNSTASPNKLEWIGGGWSVGGNWFVTSMYYEHRTLHCTAVSTMLSLLTVECLSWHISAKDSTRATCRWLLLTYMCSWVRIWPKMEWQLLFQRIPLFLHFPCVFAIHNIMLLDCQHQMF